MPEANATTDKHFTKPRFARQQFKGALNLYIIHQFSSVSSRSSTVCPLVHWSSASRVVLECTEVISWCLALSCMTLSEEWIRDTHEYYSLWLWGSLQLPKASAPPSQPGGLQQTLTTASPALPTHRISTGLPPAQGKAPIIHAIPLYRTQPLLSTSPPYFFWRGCVHTLQHSTRELSHQVSANPARTQLCNCAWTYNSPGFFPKLHAFVYRYLRYTSIQASFTGDTWEPMVCWAHQCLLSKQPHTILARNTAPLSAPAAQLLSQSLCDGVLHIQPDSPVTSQPCTAPAQIQGHQRQLSADREAEPRAPMQTEHANHKQQPECPPGTLHSPCSTSCWACLRHSGSLHSLLRNS